MPVEIRELVIKANISENSGGSNSSSSSAIAPAELETILKNHKQKIIAECIDQVFDLLEEKQQR